MRTIVIALILTFVSGAAARAQMLPALTKDQIEHLIPVLPDKTLAREIERRGTDFKVDQSILKHFSEAGSGIETLSALEELLPNARLAIDSVPPNCDVSLNGVPVGKTDDSGKLDLSNLDAGSSSIEISKDNYRIQTYGVTLMQNETTEVLATLQRDAGYLSISTNPPSARVIVQPQDRKNATDDAGSCKILPPPDNLWECAPGQYTIEAHQEGFRPSVETARVVDGQTTNVSFDLLPEHSVPDSVAALPNTMPAVNYEPPDRPAETKNRKDVGSLQLLALVQNAMGGRSNLAAVRDWQQTAKETWKPSRGTSDLTTMFSAPSSLRVEFAGGNRTVNYSNGVTGWTWSSSHDVARDLPMDTATGMVFRTLNTLVLSDSDPECEASLVAPGTIVLSDQYRNVVTLKVDLHRWLPQSLSWRNSDGAMLEETYSDWRKVGGVMLWFHMTRARDGNGFVEVRVRNYRINTGLTTTQLSAAP